MTVVFLNFSDGANPHRSVRFSSRALRILGDPGAFSRAGLSSDHFQTVKRMLASDWAQKMLCIIVPNRRTTSPEFFSWVRTRRLIGSLSSDDDDHNDDFKKTTGLMIKTTALHVHHAFWYISLTSTARQRRKIWRFMEDVDILRRIFLHLFEPE